LLLTVEVNGSACACTRIGATSGRGVTSGGSGTTSTPFHSKQGDDVHQVSFASHVDWLRLVTKVVDDVVRLGDVITPTYNQTTVKGEFF